MKYVKERGAGLQRCLAGTFQHFEDLVLGRFPNALEEGQEAARGRGFGQARWLQLLLYSLPMFKKLRGVDIWRIRGQIVFSQ